MAKDSGSYDTFDSGAGPVIPDKGNYDNRDSKGGLHTDNAADDSHGSVPEMPKKQR